VQIISRTGARAAAHYFEVQIDTKKNEPRIFEDKKIDWGDQRGTQVALRSTALPEGRASVDEFLEQVAIANPHVQLVYRRGGGDARAIRGRSELPPQPKEIKPHPYGIEFGSPADAARHDEPHARGVSRRRFQPGVLGRAQEICGTASCRRMRSRALFHGSAAEALTRRSSHQDHGRRPPTVSRRLARGILHGLYKQIRAISTRR